MSIHTSLPAGDVWWLEFSDRSPLGFVVAHDDQAFLGVEP